MGTEGKVQMRLRTAFLLFAAGVMLAACQIRSGGLGNYYAPGTSYQYNRLNPDDFNGGGGHGHP